MLKKEYASLKSVILLITLCLLMIQFTLSDARAAEKITVTDLAGREVTLEVPAKRIVLAGWSGSGAPFYTLFALLGDEAPQAIVGMDPGLKKYRHWIWQKFLEKYPTLQDVPEIGDPPDLPVEKIISLKPDVVMTTVGAYKSGIDSYRALENAGIPVVLNDYHAETLDKHLRSMKLIGDVVGRPERTRELMDFYRKQCALVEGPLAKASGTTPRVYAEVAVNPNEYSDTYGDYMWGALIERAHGQNITKGVIEGEQPASPEFVLKSNPQVVVLAGSNWPKWPESLRLGYFAEAADSRTRLKRFLTRPGWDGMEAVKNRRVYGIHHGLAREIWDFYPIQCFAKWFYPDLFADLDPLSNFKEFHEKFLGVDYSGVWSVELD